MTPHEGKGMRTKTGFKLNISACKEGNLLQEFEDSVLNRRKES